MPGRRCRNSADVGDDPHLAAAAASGEQEPERLAALARPLASTRRPVAGRGLLTPVGGGA